MSTTATVQLERAVGRAAPVFRQLFAHQGAGVIPRTLRVDARLLVNGASEEQQRNAALRVPGAGVWWSEFEGSPDPWPGGAALRLTYGSHPGIRRTVYADLRPGEYAIPPCSTFELAAAYWTADPDAGDLLGTQLLELSAEIADGEAGESSPLLLSATKEIDGSGHCMVPPGAYAWDVYADVPVRARCGAVTTLRVPNGGPWEPPTTPHPIVGPDAQTVDLFRHGQYDSGRFSPTIVFYVR